MRLIPFRAGANSEAFHKLNGDGKVSYVFWLPSCLPRKRRQPRIRGRYHGGAPHLFFWTPECFLQDFHQSYSGVSSRNYASCVSKIAHKQVQMSKLVL
jgi:hypothetical protein